MIDQQRIDALVAEAFAANMAAWETERAAAQTAAVQQATAWRDAFAPVAVACGARPIAIDHLVEQARSVFELRDGRVVAKPGVMHPRDSCADYDPVTWLADLRNGDAGDLLFTK